MAVDEDVRDALAVLLRQFGVGVDVDHVEVDVDTDPELADEYGERVPYVLIDGNPAFKYEIEERDLRLKLLAAT